MAGSLSAQAYVREIGHGRAENMVARNAWGIATAAEPIAPAPLLRPGAPLLEQRIATAMAGVWRELDLIDRALEKSTAEDVVALAQLAEKVIRQLTYWVIERASAQYAAWRACGVSADTLAINLSVYNLQDADLAGFVADALRKWKIPGSWLSSRSPRAR